LNNRDLSKTEVWSNLLGGRDRGMLRRLMEQVAAHLIDILGQPFEARGMRIKTEPINQLIYSAAEPEVETVGIYLLSGDDLPGHALLVLSLEDALLLVDWMLEAEPGMTVELGELERSALAETGNLILSSFLNEVAELIGRPLRLSPPVVIVDMLATVLEAAVMPVAAVADELLIIETDFYQHDTAMTIRFWILPDELQPILLTGSVE